MKEGTLVKNFLKRGNQHQNKVLPYQAGSSQEAKREKRVNPSSWKDLKFQLIKCWKNGHLNCTGKLRLNPVQYSVFRPKGILINAVTLKESAMAAEGRGNKPHERIRVKDRIGKHGERDKRVVLRGDNKRGFANAG